MQLVTNSVNGMEMEYIDIAPLPMLNTDLEVNGTYPPAVEAFRQKILRADCYLFASPEYNYSVTGTLNYFLLLLLLIFLFFFFPIILSAVKWEFG